MEKGRYVDGFWVDPGDTPFNEGPVRVTKKAKSLTGLFPVRPKRAGKGGASVVGRGGKAGSVRAKLRGLAKRSPEVMVRISGGGRGMKHIAAHLDYISRNGKIDLEDQDGNVIVGKDDVRSLKDEVAFGGFRIADVSDKREGFNIVLSMPAGTDPLAVKRAARDFAADEFAGHQYAMALHTFETDPDPKPSKNPHVHLWVKARDFQGVRINPRKADLQRWREGFAGALRAHGVDALATNRSQRFQQRRGVKQSVYQMRARGVKLERFGKGSATQAVVDKAKKTEEGVIAGYTKAIVDLAQSASAEDRAAARALLVKYAGSESNAEQTVVADVVKQLKNLRKDQILRPGDLDKAKKPPRL